MDRINSLPDEIICHILSFLSTKEAALTSVLARRWRDLFAFTSNLRFEENDFVYRNSDYEIPGSFIDFLDRTLALSGNSSLKNFSPKFRNGIDSAHINRWICNVLSRGVLQSLHLDVVARGLTSLPLEIFTCKTLVKLKLGRGFVIDTVPMNASLPALKTLFLDQILFSNSDQGCAFETLVSACTVLEDLTILAKCLANWNWWNCYSTVSCPTLQRLTISCNNVSVDFGSITFDTPNLSCLEYYGFVPDEYPVVNLKSFIEAKLTLVPSNLSDPTSLLKGLRNVASLNLSTRETSDSFYSFHEEIPVLKHLSRLSIGTGMRSCWKLLPVLLKQSPNLETLIIKGPLQYNRDFHYNGHGEFGSVCNCLSGYSFLLSCPVKVMKITGYSGRVEELEHMKHFLEKLSCLELLEICAWATNEEAKLQLATDLLMLPGGDKIKLQFIP